MKAPSLKPWVQRVEIEADGWSMLVCWYERWEEHVLGEPDTRPWWKRWFGKKPNVIYILREREAHSEYGYVWRWYDAPGRAPSDIENRGEEIVQYLKRSKKGVWRRDKPVRRCIEVGNGPYRRPPSGC